MVFCTIINVVFIFLLDRSLRGPINKLWQRAIVGLVVAIGLFGLPAQALENPGGVGINPADPKDPVNAGWFIYTVDPGTVIEDVAKIINNDKVPLTVNVDVEDAGTLADGGFALSGKENSTTVGVWTELEKTQVTVPAKSSTLVKFKINVPTDAEVGEHAGGIVVWKASGTPDATTKVGKGAQVNVIARVGARVYLTVKGDVIQDLDLKRKGYFVRGGELHFRYTFKNNGNIRSEPVVNTRLYGIFGPAGVADLKAPQISPKKEATVDLKWTRRAPLFGPYLAVINIGEGYQVPEGLNVVQPFKNIRTVVFLFLVPWDILGWALLALALMWLGYHFFTWRKLVGLAATPVVSYKVKRGDTIASIAAKSGIGWKLLAVVNDIKPPYAIAEGQMLHLPDPSGKSRAIALPKFWGRLWPNWLKPKRLARSSKPTVASTKDKPKAYFIAVVEKGDTLASIARYFKVSRQAIIDLNKLKSPYRLRSGQEIKIPETKPRR